MIKINRLYYITFLIILFIFCSIIYNFEKSIRVNINLKINFLDDYFNSISEIREHQKKFSYIINCREKDTVKSRGFKFKNNFYQNEFDNFKLQYFEKEYLFKDQYECYSIDMSESFNKILLNNKNLIEIKKNLFFKIIKNDTINKISYVLTKENSDFIYKSNELKKKIFHGFLIFQIFLK